jgi:hypothetical protein
VFKEKWLSYKVIALRRFVVVYYGVYVNIGMMCQNGTNSTRIATAGRDGINNKQNNLRHKISTL